LTLLPFLCLKGSIRGNLGKGPKLPPRPEGFMPGTGYSSAAEAQEGNA